MPRVRAKKTAAVTAVRGGGVVSPFGQPPPSPDSTPPPRRPFRARSSYLTPAERIERLAMTGWSPAWVAERWGVEEAELAAWIAGTARQRVGFDRWLWRMSNVITAALPSVHPPRLKPPPIRLREMALTR
jgi:hypothetical protein